MMWVGVIGLIITIITGVSKLSAQLATLSEKIASFAKSVDNFREDLSSTRERLAKVEASAKSAHHRLDDFGKELTDHINGGG